MNKLHQVINAHRSIRKYKNEPVKDKDMQMLLDAVMHTPTSINGQQFSVIVIKNQDTKDQIADLCGGQPWISQAPVFLMFVADYSKVATTLENRGVKFENIDSIEASLVGAVDCGIAFGSVMNMAESLGYGIVPIGAVRRKPDQVIDLLKLPKYVYPILGMCIGVPDEDPQLKPRFTPEMTIHQEVYSPVTQQQIDQYDKIVREYMDLRTGGTDVRSWSDLVTTVYSKVYFPEVLPSMSKQGFTNKK